MPPSLGRGMRIRFPERQDYREGCACIDFALDLHPAIVSLDYLFCNRQSEAGVTVGAGPVSIDLEEALENARTDIERDEGAGVMDGEDEVVVSDLGAHLDPATGRGVTDGV